MLKNKLGLRDQAELGTFEALSVVMRAEEPLPVGRFSAAHYCSIRRHLFQDVYGWAGRYRTVRMTKERSPFCFPGNIPAELRALFARLRGADFLRGRAATAFAEEVAAFLAYLNAIHPFREGNGRTQLTFTAVLPRATPQLAVEPASFLQVIASFFGDEAPLGQPEPRSPDIGFA